MFYNLLDHKFGAPTMGTPSGTITWSADLSGLTPTSGSTVADLEDSLQDAFNAWEDVAALTFQESTGSVDIPISTFDFFDPAVLGVANFTDNVPGLNDVSPVRVRFDTDWEWTPTADSDPDTINFFAVAAHEIGHAIGLAHVSDGSQLMAAELSADNLQTGDIGGAQALYGLDGGDVEVDAEEEPDESAGGGVSDGGGGGGAGAGLLLGLLALLFGLGFGAPGAAALAARFKGDDDPEGADQAADQEFAPGYTCENAGCACHTSVDHHHHDNGYHPLFLPSIPAEDFAQVVVEDEEEDDLFLF